MIKSIPVIKLSYKLGILFIRDIPVTALLKVSKHNIHNSYSLQFHDFVSKILAHSADLSVKPLSKYYSEAELGHLLNDTDPGCSVKLLKIYAI